MKKRLTDKTGEQKEILLHFPLDLLQIAANQMVPPYKQSEQKVCYFVAAPHMLLANTDAHRDKILKD